MIICLQDAVRKLYRVMSEEDDNFEWNFKYVHASSQKDVYVCNFAIISAYVHGNFLILILVPCALGLVSQMLQTGL